MSSIIKFFVAPDNSAAASVVESGLGPGFEAVTYGNFDVWLTLEEWESLLMDRNLDELIAGGGPDVVSGDDTALVLLVPSDLTKALADACGETLGRTAERWIELRSEEGEAIDDDLAHELLGEVAALAANAARTKSSLYCWIC
ncbi:hypothetical protein NCC78_29540 [Micromonospora phytophila]|uniref:hypothetical protein n=1 Tax=Micromonospora phytophila TaxID=709888 RepID=UPI00202F7EBA|nr:hypothetical protein [Micromonospora phytophila]MCM0678788.1 hypothetical protein [Micromonospora phytophila]